MLVPNYPFVSQDEVDKFAYLVSLWIHWSYRKSKFRIPGNPAFEPDDQIRIFERITSESYVHYIQGIRSEMNLDAGTWYLDVDTHWLGVGPDETWVINTYNDMPPALYAYLVSIGEISVDGDKSKLPDGFDPHYVYPDLQGDFPRVEDDYNDLFPSLPAILFPYDDWWSDFDIAIDIGSGYVFPPTSSGGGSVNARSEAWKHGFWGAPGSDLVTIGFLYKDSAFNRANIPLQTHVNQTTDVRTRVPAAAVPAIRLMAQQFAIEGYNVFSCTSFAGINRKIARTGILSAHAWGLAIDINPSVNGCCKTPWLTWIARPTSNAFYQAAQTIINNIRTKDTNTRVFGWGAYWQHKKDYMHIEIICTRSQILEGVVVL